MTDAPTPITYAVMNKGAARQGDESKSQWIADLFSHARAQERQIAALQTLAGSMAGALESILSSQRTTRRDTMEGDELMLTVDPQDVHNCQAALAKYRAIKA